MKYLFLIFIPILSFSQNVTSFPMYGYTDNCMRITSFFAEDTLKITLQNTSSKKPIALVGDFYLNIDELTFMNDDPYTIMNKVYTDNDSDRLYMEKNRIIELTPMEFIYFNLPLKTKINDIPIRLNTNVFLYFEYLHKRKKRHIVSNIFQIKVGS